MTSQGAIDEFNRLARETGDALLKQVPLSDALRFYGARLIAQALITGFVCVADAIRESKR